MNRNTNGNIDPASAAEQERPWQRDFELASERLMKIDTRQRVAHLDRELHRANKMAHEMSAAARAAVAAVEEMMAMAYQLPEAAAANTEADEAAVRASGRRPRDLAEVLEWCPELAKRQRVVQLDNDLRSVSVVTSDVGDMAREATEVIKDTRAILRAEPTYVRWPTPPAYTAPPGYSTAPRGDWAPPYHVPPRANCCGYAGHTPAAGAVYMQGPAAEVPAPAEEDETAGSGSGSGSDEDEPEVSEPVVAAATGEPVP